MDYVFGQLVDTHFVAKPTKFSGEQSSWDGWKFVFVNYLALVAGAFPEGLHVAEIATRPITVNPEADAGGFERGRVLFALLVSLLPKGKCLTLARSVRDRNGWELWRLLCGEYEPRTAARGFALLGNLMNPDLSGDLEEFEVKLLAWESSIEDYDESMHKEYDDDIKRATLVTPAPAALREHLSLHADRLLDYRAMASRAWLT